MLRRTLLACGIAASLLYVGIDVLAAFRYPEYHSFTSRVISELMASGAPTERLVDPLFLSYGVLMIGFGIGVWRSDHRRRGHILAGLLIGFAALGLLGPTLFEMDVRGAAGASQPSAADIWHIAITGGLVLFILATVAVGAFLRGRAFRLYSFATVVIMVASGVLTSLAMGQAGTPWVGLIERVDIGAFLVWVAVLAIALLRAPTTAKVLIKKVLQPRSLLRRSLYLEGVDWNDRGASPRAFGAPGAGGSFAFADPDAHLGFAYVMNKMDFYLSDDPREKSLRDAVYRAISVRERARAAGDRAAPAHGGSYRRRSSRRRCASSRASPARP